MLANVKTVAKDAQAVDQLVRADADPIVRLRALPVARRVADPDAPVRAHQVVGAVVIHAEQLAQAVALVVRDAPHAMDLVRMDVTALVREHVVLYAPVAVIVRAPAV